MSLFTGKPLLTLSAVGGLIATGTLILPSIAIPDRFGPTFFELLWFDGIWKQWSGYVLLALSVAALVFTGRTRLWLAKVFNGHDGGPLAHIWLGIGCTLVLFAHTGFRLGANVNAVLMVCYLATLIFGALAGMSMGGLHDVLGMKVSVVRKMYQVAIWLHLIAFFPFLALLIIHVLIVYLY